MATDKGSPTTLHRLEAARGTAARFGRMIPEEAACLEWLKSYKYRAGIVCQNKTCSRYGEVTKHHRVLSRRSYCCAHCGHHVHPTAGTLFHKSPTPLRLWFYAIYLMASTGCTIPAREIQRQLDVTYKTAWRMCTQIRPLFDETVPADSPPATMSLKPLDGARPLGLGPAIAAFVASQELASPASH